MKHYLLLFALIMTSFSQAQSAFTTCEAAENAAKKDAENGNYVQRNYGKPMAMTVDIDTNYNPFFKTMMFSKYGVTIVDMGCVIREHDSCYSNMMNSLMEAKFGKSFFETAEKEIKALYNKTNKEAFASLLDLEKTYPMSMLEKKAELNGNFGDLNKSLKTLFSISDKENYDAKITLVISNKGEITDFILSPTISNNKSKAETIETLKKLGNWNSGSIYGEKVHSEFALTYAYL